MKKPKMLVTGEQPVDKLGGQVTQKLLDDLLTTYSQAVDRVEKQRFAMNENIALFREAQRELVRVARECTEKYREKERA